jgi:hypothetical protein
VYLLSAYVLQVPTPYVNVLLEDMLQVYML